MSISATFAADEDAILNNADNEVAIDETVLTAEEDADALEVNNDAVVGKTETVTNETFFSYFSDAGELTSDADELVFEGDFSDLGISQISIAGTHPVKFTGKNATFKNVQFWIQKSDVTIDGFNILTDDSNQHTRLIWIGIDDYLSDIVLSNNNIVFIGPADEEAFAIYAGADENMGFYSISGLQIINNNITYVGNTDGSKSKKNNVIRVSGDDLDSESDGILVKNNTFNITIPSVKIPRGYFDEPLPVSEGIVFYYCDDVQFIENRIDLRYNKVSGSPTDTINIVSAYANSLYMTKATNIIIKDNEINALGHSYTYGVFISADDFEISDNKINITSDIYYACGIDVEGPSTGGNIYNNNISLNVPTSSDNIYAVGAAYGIYSAQVFGAIRGVTYEKNTIDVNGYFACGMEIMHPDPMIKDNVISCEGNYTCGIVGSLKPVGFTGNIENNKIYCSGSNVGTAFTGDSIVSTNSIGIDVLGTVIIKNNEVESTEIGINIVKDKFIPANATIDNNKITVIANNGKVDNYAIVVTGDQGSAELNIINNNVSYYGLVDYQFTIAGSYEYYGEPYYIYDSSNNTRAYGVYVKDSNVVIKDNNFDIAIPTFAVNWGATRESFSEGIVLEGCDDLEFTNNNVTITANGGSSWDTIYGIDILNSANPSIEDNNITINGAGYAYGIIINDDGFTIATNYISVYSDNYACGIDIEGKASGKIIFNYKILASATESAYPIYSGMTSGDVNVRIAYNDEIIGKAYYVVGLEIEANKTEIENNLINVEGNHTIGIGVKVKEATIADNEIISKASNIGNQYVWDSMGTDTTGIKVLTGDFDISNNNIETTGDYAAILGDNNGNVTNNHLLSSAGAGNDAIIGLGNVNATGNPATDNARLKVIIFAKDLTKVYGSDDKYSVTVLDENGKPVVNKTIIFVFDDGLIVNGVTDAEGVATVDINFVKGDYFVTARFEGDSDYGSKSTSNNIVVNAKPTAITAPNKSVLLTAVKKGSTYKVTLKDDSGDVLADKKVTINGKEFTTDKNGVVNYKLSASKAGTQKLTINFAGDDKYAASTATATIKFTKEATKLTAAKKVYKVKAKAKKYTVTLKDSKNKGISKVRITIKLAGRTYKAFTNAKGIAVFNFKLAKAGNFKAAVKFAGNNYYNKAGKTVVISVKK